MEAPAAPAAATADLAVRFINRNQFNRMRIQKNPKGVSFFF